MAAIAAAAPAAILAVWSNMEVGPPSPSVRPSAVRFSDLGGPPPSDAASQRRSAAAAARDKI